MAKNLLPQLNIIFPLNKNVVSFSAPSPPHPPTAAVHCFTESTRRTHWIKNLLAEICHFNTQKYKNLFSQARSSSFIYVGYS